MRIELTESQTKEIAKAWIIKQQENPEGFKAVLNALLDSAHCAQWAWDDAIFYAVKRCAKNYAVDADHILQSLKER